MRYENQGSFKEEFFFCKCLELTTKGEDIFQKHDEFLAEEGLKWENCVGACTDGAKSMTGKTKGFVSYIKQRNPDCKNTHCVIHRKQLADKLLPEPLKIVLDEQILMVNFIKNSSTRSRIFEQMSQDMGNDHGYVGLLWYNTIRWLSRGKTSERFYIMKEELKEFYDGIDTIYKVIEENGVKKNTKIDIQKFRDLLDSPAFIMRVAYLVDIFREFNEMNLKLQGHNLDLIKFLHVKEAFLLDLAYYKNQVALNKSVACFPNLHRYLDEFEGTVPITEINKLRFENFGAFEKCRRGL